LPRIVDVAYCWHGDYTNRFVRFGHVLRT